MSRAAPHPIQTADCRIVCGTNTRTSTRVRDAAERSSNATPTLAPPCHQARHPRRSPLAGHSHPPAQRIADSQASLKTRFVERLPKNAKLKADRGIGFEEIVFHIERGDLLDILEHPNPDRYAGQHIFVVQREDYVYLVPFVEDEHSVFLKTIIPSRKATKQYLGEESDDED